MSSSKKNYLYRGFGAGVYLSEAQNPIPARPTHCIRVQYTEYLFTQGRGEGGGELKQREGQRGTSSRSWIENTNMTHCISSL
jgi:hypothetical protein